MKRVQHGFLTRVFTGWKPVPYLFGALSQQAVSTGAAFHTLEPVLLRSAAPGKEHSQCGEDQKAQYARSDVDEDRGAECISQALGPVLADFHRQRLSDRRVLGLPPLIENNARDGHAQQPLAAHQA